MKLSFTNTVDELVFLTLEVYQNSPTLKRSLRMKRQLILGVYLLLAVVLYQSTGWAVFTLVFLAVTVAFVIYLKPLHMRAMRRHFKRYYAQPENKLYLEKQSISIGPKGIDGRNSKVESLYKWTSLTALVEYPDCYLILIEAGRAWCIPKRIFKKGEEAEFLRAMKKVPFVKKI